MSVLWLKVQLSFLVVTCCFIAYTYLFIILIITQWFPVYFNYLQEKYEASRLYTRSREKINKNNYFDITCS